MWNSVELAFVDFLQCTQLLIELAIFFRKMKSKLLYSLVISTLALAFPPVKVYALPGQSAKTIVDWAKHHSILSALTFHQEPDAYYHGEGNWRGKSLLFNAVVNSPNGRVVKEQTVLVDSLLDFTPNNTEGLDVVRQIYNRHLADDFRTSQNMGEGFYKGRMFAYYTGRYNGNSPYFTVIPITNLTQEMKYHRWCQKSHEECGI